MSIACWTMVGSVILIASPTGFIPALSAQQTSTARQPERDARQAGSAKTVTPANVPVHVVKPGKLAVTVTEKGIVETSYREFATCRVEGSATILRILPDGSLVRKGELICELDPAQFRNQLDQASVAEQQADADHQNAKLTREIAETAVREHIAAKRDSDQATLKDLKAEVEKCRSDEQVKRTTWEIEKRKIKHLGVQVARCQIFSSVDGLLQHANDNRRLNHPPQIVAGATVRQGQIVAFIHDLASPLSVNTKVPAPLVRHVKRGRKATITIEALPAERLNGIVRSVAPVPDQSFFFAQNDVKRYTTKVEIEKPPAGVRLGMTAQVEILGPELENVLSVPVDAVARFAGKDHVAVKKPDGAFAWREVTLGQSNTQFVEVKQGLKSGEIVAIDPPSLLDKPR